MPECTFYTSLNSLLTCEANYCILLNFIVQLCATLAFSYSSHRSNPRRFLLPSLQSESSGFQRPALTGRPLHPLGPLLITWFPLTLLLCSFPPFFVPAILILLSPSQAPFPPSLSSCFSCSVHVSSGAVPGSSLPSLLFLSQKASLLVDFGHLSSVDNSQIDTSQSNLLF